ncbi:Possible hemagglutinin (DUF638) [Moraxella atlantae]|uniref:Possible hemagglutinin (DUF638) n=1 Tax=Faucicola atlantae TaxID=34059 RepID=A0A378QLH4_9GAMM|nr:hypothetical protein B5J92_04350 [Moraxella atlantae]STZ01729.1 Possible hemagglutinin (DUF638) [Moraxella atlantae]
MTGSDINLAGDLYNNVEGDVTYQAASGTGYDRTSHQSSGFGVGGYASTQSGAGITANANRAKGYGNGETTTHANSHIHVGGTTYQNIGGNLVLDGAVVKGDYATGHIGGGIIAASRQDTAKYDGKNTNAGFSADIDLSKAGTGSNLSVNGGRTRANADYAAVTEQTGLQYRKSDMVVDGKSTFKGAYFTTATPEDNQTQFNGGLEVSDIQNHSQYKADGIGVGLSAGMNPTTNQMNPPGIGGIGYGRDSDSQTSTTYGAVTGMAGKSDVTTANVGTLNETLVNSFDKDRVNAQINAQVSVTQAFDTERRSYRLEMAQKEQELRDKADKITDKESQEYKDLIAKANKQQEDMVLFDSITGAIYGPNANGATGYVARAVAPEVSYQIGQYFKGTNSEGSAPHILAHGILAAAVSVATGNDPTTGALSAMGAEASAKAVSHYVFGTDKPSDLTAEQKQTVSSIVSLAGIGVGATTGDVSSAVSAGETAKSAVDDNINTVLAPDPALMYEIENNPNYSREQLEAIQRIPEMLGSLNLVYKKNDKGHFIICLPYSGNSCAPRPNERYATEQEVKQGAQDFALDVVPLPGGKGVAVIVKKTGQIVGKYKNARAARKAADEAMAEAKVGNNFNRDNDSIGNKPLGGGHRANQYGHNWKRASLSDARKKFAGDNPEIIHTKSGKIIHKNRETGIEVVYDREGDYFTIIDPSISGKRNYLDLDGKVPNNKTLPNGKQAGRSNAEYREATHFKVDR